MKIEKILGTNIDLTPAIEAHINKRIAPLSKLVKRLQPASVAVEVGKPSEHHNKGNVFYAEFNADIQGEVFHATAEAEDLYAAIDKVQKEFKRQIVDWRKKQKSVGTRAGRSFKKFLRFGREQD